MENLMEWIKDNYGSGCCRGHGRGSGRGNGYSVGSGRGDGYGSGHGDCSGFGDCDCLGYNYGYGRGCGSGFVDDSGCGSGFVDDSGLKQIGDDIIYKIDGVPTIISHIRKNVAKGFILNKDLSKNSCYIVKGNGLFAHGKTLKEAQNALVAKYMDNLDKDEVIEKFLSEFKKEKKYKGDKFFEWHHYLTGSCLMGREQFVKNHGIDLEHVFTVEEFFDICRDSYGSNVIERLEKEWRKRK